MAESNRPFVRIHASVISPRDATAEGAAIFASRIVSKDVFPAGEVESIHLSSYNGCEAGAYRVVARISMTEEDAQDAIARLVGYVAKSRAYIDEITLSSYRPDLPF